MRTTSILVSAAMTLLFTCGCVSTSDSQYSDSPYRDPTEVRGRGTDFSSYDFQQSAIAMVDLMLSNANLERKIREQFDGKPPVVAIMPVVNRTHRIFEFRSMELAIESKLVNSNKFDFIDRKAENILAEEKTHDAESVLTNEAGATDFGNLARADYLLTGEINEFLDSYGRTHDRYYKLTMKLLNKKTGKIDWSGEKEIRKVATRPSIGW